MEASESIECAVSAGPGVQCSATRDGSITVSTRDGPIEIVLRRMVNGQRFPFGFVERWLDRGVQPPSLHVMRFCFAGSEEGENLARQEENDGKEGQSFVSNNSKKASAGRVPWYDGHHAFDIGRKEKANPNNCEVGPAEAEEADQDTAQDEATGDKHCSNKANDYSDHRIKFFCQTLGTKILDKWKGRSEENSKQGLENVHIDPPACFNDPTFRLLFYKMYVADRWEKELLKKDKPENCPKSRLLQSLLPEYSKSSKTKKDTKRKMIDRYITQGNIIKMLFGKYPGLIITVSQYITTTEFDYLSKHRDDPLVYELHWLDKTMIEASKEYSEAVKEAFDLMPRFFDTKEATPIQNPRDESRKRPFSPPLSNDQSFQAQAFLEQNTVTNGEKYGYASAVSLSQYHNSVGLSLPIDPLGYSSSAENQPISNSTLVESSSGNLLTLQQNRKVPHYSSINSRPTTGGDTGVDPTTCEPRFDYASQGIFCNMMVELPYEAPIFTSVQRGDVNWTRMLFTSSPWLINAVDPYGFGLFYYASYYCWKGSESVTAFQMVKALLQMGVNPFLPDDIGNTPEKTMLDNILCARAMGEYSLEHAKSAISNTAVLFDNNSTDLLEEYMKSRGFTDLHRVLLGVHDHDISLPDYLRAYPHTVDWKDHQGRSPLAWAVEYGWADAAETLIGFGANFDQLRTSARGGASPLLHLAIAGPRSRKTVAIVRVLLNAGINVNAIDEEGWTAMHIAASWNFYEVVAEIVQRQPDLSMFTIVGETAHDLAVQAGADDSVKRLLQIPCCL